MDDTIKLPQMPKVTYDYIYICYNGQCKRFGEKTAVTADGACLWCRKMDVSRVKKDGQ